MNDIAQLIFNFVDYELFYKLKDIYGLSEKLYWKNKELPGFADAVVSGPLNLVKFLHNKGKSSIDELLKVPNGVVLKTNLHIYDAETPSMQIIYNKNSRRPNETLCGVFDFAVMHNHLDIAKYLYEIKFLPSYDSAVIACRNHNVEMLSLLHSFGCSLEPVGFFHNYVTLVQICEWANSIECLNYLNNKN